LFAPSPSSSANRPDLHRHVVQFFADAEQALAANVAAFLAEGLAAGEGAIVIALRENRNAVRGALRALDIDVEAAVAAGRLVTLDASETLASLLVDGHPDRGRFEQVVGEPIRAFTGTGVSAYGEMVGILWRRGERRAAIELEALWNELLAYQPYRLFCGYPIDVFGDEFRPADLDEILCAHTHLVPALGEDVLGNAIERAMDEILAGSSSEMRRLMKPNYRPAWATIPRGEGLVLWLRNNLADVAETILDRAKAYYRTCA
jgi:MEDS: MEthanogen/methylotroph, DcmR Sensory domain